MFNADSFAELVRFEAIAVIALSAHVLWRRLKHGILLNATSGLHTSVFLFMGLGPAIHTFNSEVGDLVPHSELMHALVWPLGWFVLGYACWCVIDHRKLIPQSSRLRLNVDARSMHLGILFVVASVAMVAHLLSGFEFTRSSVGTIVPVLEGLFYPAILAAMLRWRSRDVPSVLFALPMLSVSIYLAFFSAWRSQLVVLGVCAILTFSLKYKRGFWYGLALAPIIVYIILPFQFLKRNNYAIFDRNVGLFIAAAIQMSWEDRNASVVEFIGLRINTAREMSYVQVALDTGDFSSRMGEGYLETVEQLIPRILWPDKPSFTEFTNKVLPHLIGLISDDDDYTSWGVGLWAEFILNFPAYYLSIFVVLVFLLTVQLDRLVKRMFKQPTILWLTHTALYFLFLSAVSAITLFPILLWTMLFLYIADRFTSRLLHKQPRQFIPKSLHLSSKVHESLSLRGH